MSQAQNTHTPAAPHRHDWWLHNVDLWRCATCGGFVRSPSIPHPDVKANYATKR